MRTVSLLKSLSELLQCVSYCLFIFAVDQRLASIKGLIRSNVLFETKHNYKKQNPPSLCLGLPCIFIGSIFGFCSLCEFRFLKQSLSCILCWQFLSMLEFPKSVWYLNNGLINSRTSLRSMKQKRMAERKKYYSKKYKAKDSPEICSTTVSEFLSHCKVFSYSYPGLPNPFLSFLLMTSQCFTLFYKSSDKYLLTLKSLYNSFLLSASTMLDVSPLKHDFFFFFYNQIITFGSPFLRTISI